MSPEAPSSNQGEHPLNTPELLQECPLLGEMIAEQAELWESRAHSPAMRFQSMATYIAGDCSPLGHDPVDHSSEADFGGTRTNDEARFLTDYEKRRVVLSKWANYEPLDAVTPLNAPLAEYVETLEGFTSNPEVSEDFKVALRSIWRLYVLGEKIAADTGNITQFDANRFARIIAHLAKELYGPTKQFQG